MIVTVYGADGTKQRKPVGYVGKQCSKATEPYEVREIPGQMRKAPTAEAYIPEPVSVEEKTKIGE